MDLAEAKMQAGKDADRTWNALDSDQKSHALQIFSIIINGLEKAPDAGGLPDKDLRWRAVLLCDSGFLSDFSSFGARLDGKRDSVIRNYPEFTDLLGAVSSTVASRSVERQGITPKNWFSYQTAVRAKVEQHSAYKTLMGTEKEKSAAVSLSNEKEAASKASKALSGHETQVERSMDER